MRTIAKRALVYAGIAMVVGGCAAKRPDGRRLDSLKASTELELAEIAFDAGELEKAASRTLGALRLDAESAPAHRLMARIRLERGQGLGAQASADTAVSLEPHSPESHYIAALVSERERSYGDAYGHYRRAMELAPGDPLYVMAASEMLVEMGRPGWARTMIESSPLHEHIGGLKQMLAQIAMLGGDAEEAVLLLREALLLSPEDTSIAEDLAGALLASGRNDEGAELLESLLEQPGYEGRMDLRHTLARAYLDAGRAGRARGAYLKAIEQAGRGAPAELWIGLGESALVAGDSSSVRRAAAELVGSAPERAEGYVLWSAWHLMGGDSAAAERSARSGLAEHPENRDLLLLIELASAAVDESEHPFAGVEAGGDALSENGGVR